MGYCDYLKRLLLPLRVYDLTAGSVNESELYALGAGLDSVAEQLEHTERESMPDTAEDEGLSRREALFAWRPAAPSTALRQASIASLLQISGDGLTLDAVNRALHGCGISAKVYESDTFGHVRVAFPDTVGIPKEFDQIQKIILDIIPLHLETEFVFR